MFVAFILRINHIIICLSKYAFQLETSGVTFYSIFICNSKTKLNSLLSFCFHINILKSRNKINIDNVPFIIHGFDNISFFMFSHENVH